jgi:hypothetical protein
MIGNDRSSTPPHTALGQDGDDTVTTLPPGRVEKRRNRSVSADERITELGTTPQHAFRDARCRNRADPINLLAPHVATSFVAERLAATPLPHTGRPWVEPQRLASDQWIPGTPNRVQAEQLVSGPLWNRYHIRIWDRGSEPMMTVASAHHEYLLTLGVARNILQGLHWPSSFDSGRRAVGDTLEAAGTEIDRDGLDLENGRYQPDAEGRAWVVGPRS